MSRSKKITDALSDLKREIKERDQTIKALQREIRSLNAELNPPVKKAKKQVEEPVSQNSCPSCKKGKITSTDLGPRQFLKCSQCDYKMVIKRNG
jgi:predicted SprT family Zn-dependent metalloprotease